MRALLDAARKSSSPNAALDRAKVEDITTGAQLSKGAFYLHFESKEEAFRELLAGVVSHLDHMLDETSDEQLATGPGDGSFKSYLDACHAKNVEIFDFIWDNRALMAMVFDGGGSASYQHLIEDFAMRAQRQTAALIQHGVDIGLYRPELDLEVAAAFIAGGLRPHRAAAGARAEQAWILDAIRLREVQWLFLGGMARLEVLVALDRDRSKLSAKRDVERGESHAGTGTG